MSSKGKTSYFGRVYVNKIKPITAHCLKKNAGGRSVVTDKTKLEPAATAGLVLSREAAWDLLHNLQDALQFAEENDRSTLEITAHRKDNSLTILVDKPTTTT